MAILEGSSSCVECASLTTKPECDSHCCSWDGTTCNGAICVGTLNTPGTFSASTTVVQTAKKKKSKKRLSDWAIVGIVLGSLAFVGIGVAVYEIRKVSNEQRVTRVYLLPGLKVP